MCLLRHTSVIWPCVPSSTSDMFVGQQRRSPPIDMVAFRINEATQHPVLKEAFTVGSAVREVIGIAGSRPIGTAKPKLLVSFPRSFPPGDSQNLSATLRSGERSLLTT